MPDNLLDEYLLPSARGGRKPAKKIEVFDTRDLTVEDLQEIALESASPEKSLGPTLLSIRHAHHRLARLIAEGVKQEEISAITGYSPSYISVIKSDPAFQELLSFYSAQKDDIFVDTVERMKSLGLTALDELQRRVTEEPESWKNRELMELTEQMLSPTVAPNAKAPVAASGVNINVSFVDPTLSIDSSTSPIIDIKPESSK